MVVHVLALQFNLIQKPLQDTAGARLLSIAALPPDRVTDFSDQLTHSILLLLFIIIIIISIDFAATCVILCTFVSHHHKNSF